MPTTFALPLEFSMVSKGVLKMWEEDGEIECLEIVLIRDEVQEAFF